MNKSELITLLSQRTHLSKHGCGLVLDNLMDLIGEEISKGSSVKLQGFGMFTRWQQTERPARNPRNGLPVMIPGRYSIKFKPGSPLLRKLNRPEEAPPGK